MSSITPPITGTKSQRESKCTGSNIGRSKGCFLAIEPDCYGCTPLIALGKAAYPLQTRSQK
jgi:hypothetical protein